MASFHLTRRTLSELDAIYEYSEQRWGEAAADRYLKEVYQTFRRLTEQPDLGQAVPLPACPFRIYPARRHVVVYERWTDTIIVITVLHQVRDIEGILGSLGLAFMEEIQEIKDAME